MDRWPLWLAAAGIAMLLAGLALPLTDGDSALYATIARDALRSGEWVTFTFRGGQVFDKPPLTIWLLGLSMALFGTAEWAVRFWHLVLALATALATFHLARLAFPPRQSLIAAVVLLTSGQFFYQSLVPQQDVPLTLFVTLAIYWYLRWERAARGWLAALAGVSVALAALSKGLIGVVLVGLILAAHVVLDRPRWPRGAVRDVAIGIAAFLLVAAPWFVVAGLRQGRPFIETFFLGGALGIGRFFHPGLATPSAVPGWTSYLAYLIYLPLGILPWTGWLWPALREGLRARRETAPVVRICAVWVVAVVLFLTISPGDKVIRFLLPVFPAAAVLVGSVLGDDHWTKTAGRTSLALGGLLIAVLAWVSRQPLPADAVPYLPLVQGFLIPSAGALVGGGWLSLRGRTRVGVVWLGALTLVAYAMLLTATIRQWDQISPWRRIAATVEAIASSDARVLIMAERTPFAEYYIDKPVQFVAREELRRAWEEGPVIAVVPPDALTVLPSGTPPIVAGSAPGRLLIIRNF